MSAQGPDSPVAGAGLRARLGQLLRDRGAVAAGDSSASRSGAKALGSGLRRNDDERERGTSQASTQVGEPAASVLTKTETLVARASTLVGGIAANLSASAIAAQVDSLRQMQRTREAQRRAAESALPGIALARGVRLISAEVPLPEVTARRCADFASAPTWEARSDATPAPLVFFDTETTGLAGGTGTLVFLLGIAWIADARLHLRQFLLTTPGAEREWLAAVRATMPPAATLVSFNGKTFDLPLLAARFRLGRLPDPFVGHAHWDLMHPLKRAFGKRWPDCRLQTAERRLLDSHRIDDLPGAFAPQAFSAYLRHGETRMLGEVVRHNATDIVSLAQLLCTLESVYAEPERFDADVAAIALRLQRAERAELAQVLLAQHTHDPGVRRLLARRHAREKRWAEAREMLAPLAEARFPCVDSLERLAKIAEHVERDYARALQLCERLIALQPDEARHRHRHARVLRRAARARIRDSDAVASPSGEISRETEGVLC